MIYNGYNRRLERWIINHQTGRRNLTKSQLVKAYASVEEQLKREAKERQSAGGGDKRSDKAKTVEVNLPQAVEKVPETAEIVAQKIGVSKNTYKGMKQIISEGTPEQIKRMDRGGKGNGVSAIVAEIKEEKASNDVPGKKDPEKNFAQGSKKPDKARWRQKIRVDIMSTLKTESDLAEELEFLSIFVKQ